MQDRTTAPYQLYRVGCRTAAYLDRTTLGDSSQGTLGTHGAGAQPMDLEAMIRGGKET